MKIFLLIAMVLGILGAISDIALNQWSEKMTGYWWMISACLFMIFMTGLGLCMRFAIPQGASFTSIILIVLMMNIAGVVIWDVYNGARFTNMQIVGILFAVVSIMCLEFKK